MKPTFKTVAATASWALCLLLLAGEAHAQFRGFWLDIGEYHNIYSEGGARQEEAPGIPPGMEYPAIIHPDASSHGWARAFWIGVKDWTDERGQNLPYYVARMGPRTPGIEVTSPVDTRIIARFEDTAVEVDGALTFDNLAVVDEVDPTIPADRMIVNKHNVDVGISVTRTIYGWINQFHDNYHIIDYEYCNTGNIDDDDEIELPDQTLNDVYFFRIHRWRGNAEEGWTTGNAQTWGKFSMIDIVGDGHAEYPVDFTAWYLWPGFNPDFTQYNNLGGPLWDDSHWVTVAGDSVGRLAGGDFTGRAVLHADASTTDRSYPKCTPGTAEFGCQPHTIGWMDQDEPLTSDGASFEEYYELGILTRENPARFTGGSSRMFPHYADRIEPTGSFWAPKNDPSSNKQGGHAPTDAFGPYDMAFGECVNITVVEGVAGLSYDARVQVGRAYKRAAGNNDALIAYDANGDGVINEAPFDYEQVGLPQYQGDGCTNCPARGSERMTKNQWVMSARDSLYQTFFRARDVFEASNALTQYPIPEPPRPPVRFTVDGRPDGIDLTWEPNAGGPPVDHWEVYRTSRFEDNLLDPDGNGQYEVVTGPAGPVVVTGYQKLAELPANQTTYRDLSANRGTDYFYYVVAVGQGQTSDPLAINGTPGGVALNSGRYLTQTYLPTNLKRPAYGATGSVQDARVVPNPVNLGSSESVRFSQEDRVAFFNIPGNCTIKIFSEIGELVHTIEHTDGSGDEIWNLTTSSRQLLVSGIYIAVIEDLDQGGTTFLKFTVIR
ncbi:MAG: hypothetical protein R3247_05680 [Rhodothermales bacterium]|nr:hypothetical protein [Rhodothermales bacterium]